MSHGICAYSKGAKFQGDILFIETDEARGTTPRKESGGAERWKSDRLMRMRYWIS